MNWSVAMPLPGVVPLEGLSILTGTRLDPVYYNLDSDFLIDGEPLPTGEGTWYQFPTTRQGHLARAWQMRGWTRFELAGTAQLTRSAGYTDACAINGALEIPAPAEISFSHWTRILGGTPPTRDYSAIYELPVGADDYQYGMNVAGNIGTVASSGSLDLMWRSPISGGGWNTISQVATGEAAYDLSLEQWVTFDLITQAKMQGNSGAVRNTAVDYFSLMRLQLRSAWIPAGFTGDLEPYFAGIEGGPYVIDDDPDATSYDYPNPMTADTVFPGDPGLHCGTASFGGSGAVAFAPNAVIRATGPSSLITPSPVLFQGHYTLSTCNFSGAFFWTPPASL